MIKPPANLIAKTIFHVIPRIRGTPCTYPQSNAALSLNSHKVRFSRQAFRLEDESSTRKYTSDQSNLSLRINPPSANVSRKPSSQQIRFADDTLVPSPAPQLSSISPPHLMFIRRRKGTSAPFPNK